MTQRWKTHLSWGLAGLCLSATLVQAQTQVKVDQGWSAAQKNTWYSLSQGSRLVPLSWLQALEQSDSTDAFLAAPHIEKFRYLPRPATQGGLPIGFTVDRQDDSQFSNVTKLRWKQGQSSQEPWVGMNCAACHTNDLTYRGKRLRIDGAPTLADFSGFILALNAALTAARDDPSKWQRFAQKALGKTSNTPQNQEMLKAELNKLIDWQNRVETANSSTSVPAYGFGRLDAIGHIFNKVLLRTDTPDQAFNPSNAPVSYPFLWNIHQHDKVQWNGMVANGPVVKGIDLGALGRNVGEVTGVFADLTLKSFGPAINGYPTSANVINLIALEQQLAKLKPPVWPSTFPPINAEKWAAGEQLFKSHCQECHAVLAPSDLRTPIKAVMTPLNGPQAIGTDPGMACNALMSVGKTGVLGPSGFLKFGTPKKFFVFSSPGYGEAASVAEMLSTTVVGSLWFKRNDILVDLEQHLTQRSSPSPHASSSSSGAETQAAAPAPMVGQGAPDASLDALTPEQQRCLRIQNPLLAYKGRPLNGIWATPPYLHNGSVPSLMDLLLPPQERVQSFALGTREFDPERVGLVTDNSSPEYKTERAMQDNTWVFKTRSDNGQLLLGNSNLGHDYGNASFSQEQREALVEYMKAVGAKTDGKTVFSNR